MTDYNNHIEYIKDLPNTKETEVNPKTITVDDIFDMYSEYFKNNPNIKYKLRIKI